MALDNYFKPSVENKSKIYRSADYRKRSVLEFSGAAVDHVELERKLAEHGYGRLWVEANFNYYTEKITNTSNRIEAKFLFVNPSGSESSPDRDVSRHVRFNTAGSVQNVWVFLNYKMIMTGYEPARYTVKPYIFVWFLDEWSQWSNTDWFQMTKWACWFSKS